MCTHRCAGEWTITQRDRHERRRGPVGTGLFVQAVRRPQWRAIRTPAPTHVFSRHGKETKVIHRFDSTTSMPTHAHIDGVRSHLHIYFCPSCPAWSFVVVQGLEGPVAERQRRAPRVGPLGRTDPPAPTLRGPAGTCVRQVPPVPFPAFHTPTKG